MSVISSGLFSKEARHFSFESMQVNKEEETLSSLSTLVSRAPTKWRCGGPDHGALHLQDKLPALGHHILSGDHELGGRGNLERCQTCLGREKSKCPAEYRFVCLFCFVLDLCHCIGRCDCPTDFTFQLHLCRPGILQPGRSCQPGCQQCHPFGNYKKYPKGEGLINPRHGCPANYVCCIFPLTNRYLKVYPVDAMMQMVGMLSRPILTVPAI